jgi:signal transduction histidine kinase
VYLVSLGCAPGEALSPRVAAIPALVIVLVACGYAIVSRYPANIARLRRYLEDIVNGRIPEKISLVQGMADIPAIEQWLNMIVEQLNRQVSRMENQLKQIEWLLGRNVTPSFWKSTRDVRRDARGGRTAAPAGGAILSAVGEGMLADIVGELMELLETSAVVFEQNADVALNIIVSDWCRYLDETGRAAREAEGAACGADGCWCQGSWRAAALACMRSGQPVDLACSGGIRIYCAPITAAGRITGAAGFAYGDPPRDPAQLRPIAERLRVPVEDLRQKAETYGTRPCFIVSVAKNRLLTLAKLIGEIVERRQAEEVLRRSEEELRRHRDNLEGLVEERTSELKAANERLQREVQERRKAERLKDEFVSTVSHELRTPLAITKEGISLLADGIPGPVADKQAKVLHAVASNIDRLSRIINDLLDVSKIEAGKMEMHKDRIDLAQLVRQAAASLEPLATQKKLRVEVAFDAEPCEVYADPDRIMQVLTNLIGNAVKFTMTGHVRVSVTHHDGEAVCAVEDTGIGIADTDLPRLFGKFVQIGRTHGAGQKGTGLGLTIAKSIVELHGGRIWVESELNKGTTFRFTLPRLSEKDFLLDEIEQKIAAARLMGGSFILSLIELGNGEAAGDVPRLLDAVLSHRLLFRSSDAVWRKGERQLVVIAEADFSQIELVYVRWRHRIAEAVEELGLRGSIAPRFASARYPIDGVTVAELMNKVENKLASAHAGGEHGCE